VNPKHQNIANLFQEGLTRHEISEKLRIPYATVVNTVRKALAQPKIVRELSEEDLPWLKENYPTLSNSWCAKHLNTSAGKVIAFAKSHGLKKNVAPNAPRVFDEKAVCEAYLADKHLSRIAQKFDTHANMISKILKKNGIKIEVASKFRDFQDQIVADYLSKTMPTRDIGKKYGISDDRIREGLKELGIYDPSRYCLFGNTKGFYEWWVDKYGKEIADEKHLEYRKKKSIATSGEKNHMYGKPTPNGSGNGWKGWYKEHYFRSLRELMFMIECDDKDIQWESAERKKYVIEYEFMGGARTYRPDFIVGNTLIELKPTRLHASPNVTAKRIAAEKFCVERGLTYSLRDINLDTNTLQHVYQSGCVRFAGDYKERYG